MSIARPPLSRHAPATSASDCAIASPSAAIGAAGAGREQLADLRLDLGRDRDLGLQAQLLELAAHLLQLELGLGARLLAGGLGADLLGARLGVDLGLDLAQLVLLALHRGLRVRHRDLAACARGGLGLLGLARRVGLGDLGGAQDLGDPLAADALEVVAVVGDVLDLQHVELEAELLEVGPRATARGGARTSGDPR